MIHGDFNGVIGDYNQAAQDYNLARLECALLAAMPLPRPVARMMADGQQGIVPGAQSPAYGVEAIRNYFEDVADGRLAMDPRDGAFVRLRAAYIVLLRRFFQMAFVQAGLSYHGIIDEADAA